MIKEELQEKYFQFQMLMQQMQQLEQQMDQIKHNVVELVSLGENLSKMKDVTSGEDMFVPMGSGIFVKAKSCSCSSVLMNVGAGVCVEKKVFDAVDLINNQVSELKGLVSQLQVQMEEGSKVLHSLQHEISEMKG